MLERKWWTLIASCTAIFMLLVDVSIVNVALPSIQRGLHASFSDLQWVIDAYSLTLAGVLLAAGSLADKVGRLRMVSGGAAGGTGRGGCRRGGRCGRCGRLGRSRSCGIRPRHRLHIVFGNDFRGFRLCFLLLASAAGGFRNGRSIF